MGLSTRWVQVFLQKELEQRKDNEQLQRWCKATEPVLEGKADNSEHLTISAPKSWPAPWLRWKTQGKEVANKLLNTCSFCSFGGRSVDTMQMPLPVGNSVSVFSKHGWKSCYLGKNISAGATAADKRGEVLQVDKGTLEVPFVSQQNVPRDFVGSLSNFLQIMFDLSQNNIFI